MKKGEAKRRVCREKVKAAAIWKGGETRNKKPEALSRPTKKNLCER